MSTPPDEEPVFLEPEDLQEAVESFEDAIDSEDLPDDQEVAASPAGEAALELPRSGSFSSNLSPRYGQRRAQHAELPDFHTSDLGQMVDDFESAIPEPDTASPVGEALTRQQIDVTHHVEITVNMGESVADQIGDQVETMITGMKQDINQRIQAAVDQVRSELDRGNLF